MKEMFRFEFYKEWYYKEYDRRVEIVNMLNIPIGIITALVGILVYLIFNYDFETISKNLNNSFLILCILNFILLLISITYLLLAYSTKSKFYDFPKDTDFLLIERENVESFVTEENKKIKNKKNKHNIDEIYEDTLCNLLIEWTSKNATSNEKKLNYIHYAKLVLILNYVLTVFSVVIYGFNYMYVKKNNVQNNITMSEDKQKPVGKPRLQVTPVTKPREIYLDDKPIDISSIIKDINTK